MFVSKYIPTTSKWKDLGPHTFLALPAKGDVLVLKDTPTYKLETGRASQEANLEFSWALGSQ